MTDRLYYHELFPKACYNFKASVLFYHRLVEAYKFAFAKRMFLGDDRFDDVRYAVKRLKSNRWIHRIALKITNDRTHPSNSSFYDPLVVIGLIRFILNLLSHFLFIESFIKNLIMEQLMFRSWIVMVMLLLLLPQSMPSECHRTLENRILFFHIFIQFFIISFGSRVISPSTGILLNDEMDDFNTGKVNVFGLPPSFANTIQPFKRPLSSMCPSIFTDESGVRLVIGASGGSKILTAVAYVSLRNLWMREDIKNAIDAARLHHQLFPDTLVYEKCFPPKILHALKKKGHHIEELGKLSRGAIVMGISRGRNGKIRANSDHRKGGTVSGY